MGRVGRGSENVDSFARQPHTRARGRLGEKAAAAWLESHGYRVAARNVVTLAGEIDIIAWDGETLCFVEVKARKERHYGGAVASVGQRKKKRLVRAAALYLAQNRADGPVRFDVVGLDHDDGRWRFTLVRNAFEADSLFLV